VALSTRVKCKAMEYLPGVMVLDTMASTRTIRSTEKESIHPLKENNMRAAGRME
jgi:hypothetical protein